MSRLTLSRTSRKSSLRRYLMPSRRQPIWPVTWLVIWDCSSLVYGATISEFSYTYYKQFVQQSTIQFLQISNCIKKLSKIIYIIKEYKNNQWQIPDAAVRQVQKSRCGKNKKIKNVLQIISISFLYQYSTADNSASILASMNKNTQMHAFLFRIRRFRYSMSEDVFFKHIFTVMFEKDFILHPSTWMTTVQ